MQKIKLLGALLFAAILSGCASAPVFQTSVPKTTNLSGFELGRSPILDVTNHIIQHANSGKDILYSQNFGGGGVALGLLGPLGVAANIGMINTNTTKDVEQIKNKITLSPKNIFSQVASKELTEGGSGGKIKPQISPYLYLIKIDDEKILMASGLIIEQSEEKWTGKYLYQLAQTTTLQELAKLDDAGTKRLEAAVADGYEKILKQIKTEHAQTSQTGKQIHFKSSFFTPRIEIESIGMLIAKNDQVTWVRTNSGVFAVQNNFIKFNFVKP